MRTFRIETVADALACMDYMHRRELLCEKCGLNLTEWVNPNHSYCTDCKPPHGEYSAHKAPNTLEKWLCKEVQEWLKETTSEA